ncbi:hypothetical protein Poli38472_006523 [Pythium oligandrum]|uniref:Uncharacterized protein n=1 Tax=Pythium oligandrum TaxID=41045 RepID=A0A8K1C572_PYTOL|nr:hypothetical protein Poli38472_006523 [Pythium oligandrum]|eukprot:TMW56513.1 hypothetical protein Poli38472_006523 [Pythium oligandrum]
MTKQSVALSSAGPFCRLAPAMDPIKEDGDTCGEPEDAMPRPTRRTSRFLSLSSSSSSTRKSLSILSPGGRHRRSQTIMGTGDVELEQLQRQIVLEALHAELESKNRALEECQEEAQLAARIGQTLLQRNQEMGAEIETQSMELLSRAETAELEVEVLEEKLVRAHHQIRSLEVARTKAVIEAEQLAQEVEDMRMRTNSLNAKLLRSQSEMVRYDHTKDKLSEELEAVRLRLEVKETMELQLRAELARKDERIHELEESERYNLLCISRLEIENQSVCQQNFTQEHRETQLIIERDTLEAKLIAQRHVLQESQSREKHSHETIASLQTELDELRDALRTEQARVAVLTTQNRDLEDRLDNHVRTTEVSDDDDPSTQLLRSGSLFFELSKQLEAEMRDTPRHRLSLNDSQNEVETSSSDSSRTSRRSSDQPTDNNNDNSEPSTEKPHRRRSSRRRPPPLQLDFRHSQQVDPHDSPDENLPSTPSYFKPSGLSVCNSPFFSSFTL